MGISISFLSTWDFKKAKYALESQGKWGAFDPVIREDGKSIEFDDDIDVETLRDCLSDEMENLGIEDDNYYFE